MTKTNNENAQQGASLHLGRSAIAAVMKGNRGLGKKRSKVTECNERNLPIPLALKPDLNNVVRRQNLNTLAVFSCPCALAALQHGEVSCGICMLSCVKLNALMLFGLVKYFPCTFSIPPPSALETPLDFSASCIDEACHTQVTSVGQLLFSHVSYHISQSLPSLLFFMY